jgi:hypothetical protein
LKHKAKLMSEIKIDYDRLLDMFFRNIVQLVALRNIMVSKALTDRNEIETETERLSREGIFVELLDKVRVRN